MYIINVHKFIIFLFLTAFSSSHFYAMKDEHRNTFAVNLNHNTSITHYTGITHSSYKEFCLAKGIPLSEQGEPKNILPHIISLKESKQESKNILPLERNILPLQKILLSQFLQFDKSLKSSLFSNFFQHYTLNLEDKNYIPVYPQIKLYDVNSEKFFKKKDEKAFCRKLEYLSRNGHNKNVRKMININEHSPFFLECIFRSSSSEELLQKLFNHTDFDPNYLIENKRNILSNFHHALITLPKSRNSIKIWLDNKADPNTYYTDHVCFDFNTCNGCEKERGMSLVEEVLRKKRKLTNPILAVFLSKENPISLNKKTLSEIITFLTRMLSQFDVWKYAPSSYYIDEENFKLINSNPMLKNSEKLKRLNFHFKKYIKNRIRAIVYYIFHDRKIENIKEQYNETIDIQMLEKFLEKAKSFFDKPLGEVLDEALNASYDEKKLIELAIQSCNNARPLATFDKVLKLLLRYQIKPYLYCELNQFPYEAILCKKLTDEKIEASNFLLEAIPNYFRNKINQLRTWLLCMKALRFRNMPTPLKYLIADMSVLNGSIDHGGLLNDISNLEGLLNDISNLEKEIKDAISSCWYKNGIIRNQLRSYIIKLLAKWGIENEEQIIWESK